MRDKILEAMENMGEAMKIKEEDNVKILSEKIWKVGANLEYITFMIHLQKDSEVSQKVEVKFPHKVDVDAELSIVQELLKEAFSDVDRNLGEVYRKAWIARGYILRIQGALERIMSKQGQRRL